MVWCEMLSSTHPAVRRHVVAEHVDWPDAVVKFLDHKDTFDSFLVAWRKGSIDKAHVPRKHGVVGAMYPSLLDLSDVFENVCGAR